MEKKFNVNSDIIYSTKNGATRIIFLEDDSKEIITLTGPSAECFMLFHQHDTASAVRKELETSLSIKGSDENFNKMINFFVDNKLILEVA